MDGGEAVEVSLVVLGAAVHRDEADILHTGQQLGEGVNISWIQDSN